MKYNGYTFHPVRIFTHVENEMSLRQISRYLSSDIKRRNEFSRYDGGEYSLADFYKAMGDGAWADIFHCEETGLDYVPGENELFIWKKED